MAAGQYDLRRLGGNFDAASVDQSGANVSLVSFSGLSPRSTFGQRRKLKLTHYPEPVVDQFELPFCARYGRSRPMRSLSKTGVLVKFTLDDHIAAKGHPRQSRFCY